MWLLPEEIHRTDDNIIVQCYTCVGWDGVTFDDIFGNVGGTLYSGGIIVVDKNPYIFITGFY